MMPTRAHVRLLLRFALYAMGGGVLAVLFIMLRVVAAFDGTARLPADCALVFGAAVHSLEHPGPGIQRRVATAVRLYNEGLVQTIIFSGGKGSEEQRSEAEVMRSVAMRGGVAPEDIALEEQSRSTWQNLLLSAPLAQECDTVVGISDRYHLARIGYLASEQEWGSLQTLPADHVANYLFEVRSVFREAIALIYYFIILTFDEGVSAGLSQPDATKSSFGISLDLLT